MNKIIAKLNDPQVATTFATGFVEQYARPAFGSRSKSEIDLLVFSCLVQAGVIDPSDSLYDIARTLSVAPSKVRTLVLNWQLRSTSTTKDLREDLIAALQKTRFAKDGTLMSFGVESPLLREDVRARLRKRGVFADASFSAELVRLPVESFVEFLDDLLDAETKAGLQRILVKDKQLPDRSFKALATGVLLKLGEKVAGKAGEELAGAIAQRAGEAVLKPAIERLSGFLASLLRQDPKGAASMLSDDDLPVA